nr:type II secretion system protein [uncultured Cellulosilyticum sp.]
MNQKGFSFLELIIVILLSSIVGSGVVLSTRIVQEVQFKALVTKVEQGIRYAQQRAVATGKQYNVYCTKQKIYIRQGNNIPLYKIEVGDEVTIPTKNADGTFMTGKDIKFHGKMAPSQAGTIVLIHQGLKKKARITIRVATGKTTVYFESI